MVNPITCVSISAFGILLIFSSVALAMTEQSMSAGQSMTIEGKNVEMLSIGKQSILVKIGEDTLPIYVGNERTIAGIRIGVSSVNAETSPRTAKIVSYSQSITATNGEGVATLIAGESAEMDGTSVRVLSIGTNGILVMSGDRSTTISKGQSVVVGNVKVTVPSGGISAIEGRRSVKLSIAKVAVESTGTTLKAGDMFEARGRNVTVMSIGQSTVLVRVGEDSRTIAVGGEDSVNGVRIAVPLGAIGKADDGRRTVSLIVTSAKAETHAATNETPSAKETSYNNSVTSIANKPALNTTNKTILADKPVSKTENKTTISNSPVTTLVENIVFTKTVSKGTIIRDIPVLRYGDSIKVNGKTIDVYVIANDWVYLVAGSEGKMIKKAGSSKENTIGGFNVIITSLGYDTKNFRKSSVKLIVTPQ